MKTKWIVGLLTLMLLGLSVWALMPEPQRVEVDRVQQGLFQRHIQEDGLDTHNTLDNSPTTLRQTKFGMIAQ